MYDAYSNDSVLAFVAATVFDDEHFGPALTEEELDYRLKVIKEYDEEINVARAMISETPEFDKLSYKEKINYSAALLRKLKKQNEEKKHQK